MSSPPLRCNGLVPRRCSVDRLRRVPLLRSVVVGEVEGVDPQLERAKDHREPDRAMALRAARHSHRGVEGRRRTGAARPPGTWQFWQRGCCNTCCTVANAMTPCARSSALGRGVKVDRARRSTTGESFALATPAPASCTPSGAADPHRAPSACCRSSLYASVVPLEPHHLGVPLEREDVRRDAVEEPPIVRDDHRASREIDQRFLQRTQRVDVEIVRRLVEQQQVAAGHQRLREMQAGCAHPRRGRRPSSAGRRPRKLKLARYARELISCLPTMICSRPPEISPTPSSCHRACASGPRRRAAPSRRP